MAAVIGVRALKFVATELSCKQDKPFVLWSDSQCVLHWIYSTKDLGVFVRNRVKEIEQANVSCRYVASEENPADLATRGKGVAELTSFWWNGPGWLQKKEVEWPRWYPSNLSEESSAAVVKETRKTTVNLVATEEERECPFGINPEKYSTLSRLLRITAHCLRFIRKLRKGVETATKTIEHRNISVSDVESARQMWLKHVQHTFCDSIRENSKHPLTQQLGAKMDSAGLLRCHGRLANADLDYDACFPILLPGKCTVTRLIIEDCHRKSLHSGISQTLSKVRQTYWIPKGRSEVRSILYKCIVCRRSEGKAYKLPEMPELPACRVTKAAPFSFTGVDYFGPMLIKALDGHQKTWVCLFTCLTIRAVHLELVDDMSAESFLLAFRRFIARFGKPKSMISDNGPSFKAVAKFLDGELKQYGSPGNCPEVGNFLVDNQIKWHFIPEYAPWAGGMYERMVGIVKRCLRKVVSKRLFTRSQLDTLLCEVEDTVNDRPITHVGMEMSAVPLTPKNFIYPYPREQLPWLADNHDDPDFVPCADSHRSNLLSLWKKGNRYLEQFWMNWRNEYLTSLREKLTWFHKGSRASTSFPPKVGEVVLINDPMLPRGRWKMGIVTELSESSDGKIRSVKLRGANQRYLTRPVNLIYPLEIYTESPGKSTMTSSAREELVLPSEPRAKRKAAEVALGRIRQMAMDG